MEERCARAWLGVALCICAVLFSGCSAAHYRADADKEVYGIIGHKSSFVPGMTPGFDIEPTNRDFLNELPQAKPADLLSPSDNEGDNEQSVGQALKITHAKALEIASRNSRDLQTRKETVYLSALSLTLQRHLFSPSLFGSLSGRYKKLESDQTIGLDTGLGMNWLLKTGASLSVDLSSNFLRYLTGDPRKTAASLFQITFIQPLLQGRGMAATEALTQAERDMLYQLREYVRYRRSFFVGVSSSYYRVLQQRQVVENEKRNYENLVYVRERAESMAEAGRLPEFQVDQTQQDELRAKDRLQSARQSYRRVLDEFKLQLALPVDANVVLDPDELNRLDIAPTSQTEPETDAAVGTALKSRLDLKTAKAEVEDAERKVKVARNALLPNLDLILSSVTDTRSDVQPLAFKFADTQYTVGLDLDLPFDKKSERNQYRQSIINLARAQRQYGELCDRITLDVRDTWRSVRQAKSSYAIQKRSVALAEGRAESTSMLLRAGRAIARDLLEAQEALLEAQNAATKAIVDYRIARLELARDMDTLDIGKDGSLEESFEPKQ